MSNTISEAFKAIFIVFIVIGIAAGVFFTSVFAYIFFDFNSEIKVDTPITPTIELIIKDNKVDTLYIYKKP